MTRIYLDNQASTPMDDRVMEAMAAAGHGNPHSSEHAAGWEASAKIEAAREGVASLIGADPDEIFFTSGATEANNLAILGVRKHARAGRNAVMRPPIEHKSVLGACDALVAEFGFDLLTIPVDSDGRVDLDYITRFRDARTALISVALVNNEIGVIQDVASIGAGRDATLFHCDAAQGPEAVSLEGMARHCDMMSLSAHKMRGPMGIGALYITRAVQASIAPILFGGGQQSGIRPGTLPLHLCVGMGVAAEIARDGASNRAHLAKMRDGFLAALAEQGLRFRLNGTQDLTLRHPGNANILIEGADADQMISLMQPKIAASTGSACTSGSLEPSYVLTAIGLSHEEAGRSIRFSVGYKTTESDVREAAVAVANAFRNLA